MTSEEDSNNVSYNLTPIFYPRSMVVVGLSQKNYNHPGNTTFTKNKMEMKVKTYAVATHSKEVDGHHVFNSIFDLPEVPDLAVICVSARNTLQVVKECAKFGVKGLIIIGGGFSEASSEGADLEREIVDVCKANNMPMIGPNCVGVYSPPYLDTIFLPTERIIRPKQGNVALISQSGGVLLDQFFLSCQERDIGVSTAISIGNKAMINESHLIRFFEQDPNTAVIAFYLEGFSKEYSRDFLTTARCSKKDILVYLGGKTEAGKIAAGSHTASLAANNDIAQGALKQYSIISVNSELEVKNYLKIYSTLANPHRRYTTMSVRGQNVAVLSVSGGHGVLCADLMEKYHLKMSEFSAQQIEDMRLLMNPTSGKIAGLQNPIDVTGACSEDDIIYILEYLLTQPNVEMIIMLLLPYPPQISMNLGREIMKISNKYIKPIVTFVPWATKYNLIRESLELNYIPVAHTVEEAVIMAAAIKRKGASGIRKKFNWRSQTDELE